jgi:hypothetical protein
MNARYSFSTTQAAALTGLLSNNLAVSDQDVERLQEYCREHLFAGRDLTCFKDDPRGIYLDTELNLHRIDARPLSSQQEQALKRAQLQLDAFRRLYVFIDDGEPGPALLAPHPRSRLSLLAERAAT